MEFITVPFLFQFVGAIFLTFATFNLFSGPSASNPSRRYPNWGWFGMALWLVSLMIYGGLHAVNAAR